MAPQHILIRNLLILPDDDNKFSQEKVSPSAVYASCCRDESLVPVQRFQSLLQETSCNMANCLLGPKDMKPISVALVVRKNYCYLNNA